MSPAFIKVSFTETGHFRRLVRFLCDMDDLARVNADEELQEAVDRCRADLLGVEQDA